MILLFFLRVSLIEVVLVTPLHGIRDVKSKNGIYARLDRAFANHLWLTIYPNAILSNFPNFGFGNGPILLNLSMFDSLKTCPRFN